MSKKELRIIAPIGAVPSTDKDLHERIEKLPSDASISVVFREISKWEEIAVIKSRERERTTKSGVLDIICK